MAADFWAGYASGAAGIIVGNPLDIVKVHQQAQAVGQAALSFQSSKSLLAGAAAPVIGYGALNAILFATYNRAEAGLNNSLGAEKNLGVNWAAGAVSGLATWAISTPTELVKCKAQINPPGAKSSWEIAKEILRTQGIKGLYFGGTVTALRDSIGYGFYFWFYELAIRNWPINGSRNGVSLREEAPKVMFCGGLAGIGTWASVFPLDVVKTRLQTGDFRDCQIGVGSSRLCRSRTGAWEVARDTYREGGAKPFFRGLTVCSVRAFVVNAIQWAVYEGLMYRNGRGRLRNIENSHFT